MSLLQRVERAQRSLAQREAERLAAEAAAAAAQAAGTVTAVPGQAAPGQASSQIAPGPVGPGQTVSGQTVAGSGAATAVPVSPGALVPVMAPATTDSSPANQLQHPSTPPGDSRGRNGQRTRPWMATCVFQPACSRYPTPKSVAD